MHVKNESTNNASHVLVENSDIASHLNTAIFVLVVNDSRYER